VQITPDGQASTLFILRYDTTILNYYTGVWNPASHERWVLAHELIKRVEGSSSDMGIKVPGHGEGSDQVSDITLDASFVATFRAAITALKLFSARYSPNKEIGSSSINGVYIGLLPYESKNDGNYCFFGCPKGKKEYSAYGTLSSGKGSSVGAEICNYLNNNTPWYLDMKLCPYMTLLSPPSTPSRLCAARKAANEQEIDMLKGPEALLLKNKNYYGDSFDQKEVYGVKLIDALWQKTLDHGVTVPTTTTVTTWQKTPHKVVAVPITVTTINA
jgi:hypothetical protein